MLPAVHSWSPVVAFFSMLLAGCEPMVTTTTSYDVLFRSGVVSEFGYAASGGEMPVIVIGNPFTAVKQVVDQAVVDAMQGHVYGNRVRFVNAPEAAGAKPGYAVVMMFGAGSGTLAHAVCSSRRNTPAVVDGDASSVLAIFCGGGDARSWAYSRTSRASSPDDPVFRDLIAQATWAMLPPRDDDRRHNIDFGR